MGFFSHIFGNGRRLKARDAILKGLEAESPTALAPLDALPVGDRAEVLGMVLRPLMLDDRHAEAERVVSALGALDPKAAWAPAIELAQATGRVEVAIELCRAQVEREPTFVERRALLAALLVRGGQAAEALAVLDAGQRGDPDLELVRIDVLAALGRLAEAHEQARVVRDAAQAELNQGILGAGREGAEEQLRVASQRFDELAAALAASEDPAPNPLS
jgi:predicted Zn-dependent protease